MQSILWERDQTWGSSFLWKCSKFHLDFRNLAKSSENSFNFRKNGVWIGCLKHSLLQRENTGNNILENCLKISNTTKRTVFELKLWQSDEEIWEIYCLAEFSSVSDLLTCWLSITLLTQGILVIYVTTFFTVYNFGYISAMRLIFFFKMFKFWSKFQKLRKKFGKCFLFPR